MYLDKIVGKKFQQSSFDTLYLFIRGRKWRHIKRYVQRYAGKDYYEKNKLKCYLRMSYAFIRYGWWFDEYFMFNFNRLSHEGRKEFVPNIQKDYLCDCLNSPQIHELFKNKGLAAERFFRYYKRDFIVVKPSSYQEEKVRQFIEKHESFFIKPIDGSLGRGAQVVRDTTIEEVKKILKDYPSGFVAEELIKQVKELAQLHPQSVNTIRISTFKLNGHVYLIPPFIRMGRGENVMDNAAEGGIIGVIDVDTGIVTSACDEFGNWYVNHPETGARIVGFEIPQWEEALSLAKELIQVIPECKYAGWDLSYTDKGWVVVEGNSRAQFICFQTATQRGFRGELEEMLGQPLRKYCTTRCCSVD